MLFGRRPVVAFLSRTPTSLLFCSIWIEESETINCLMQTVPPSSTEGFMKKIGYILAATVMVVSTPANAMPDQVPSGWWDRMMYRLNVMADNPGFCRRHGSVWVCDYFN
jgi:hypothetical protein